MTQKKENEKEAAMELIVNGKSVKLVVGHQVQSWYTLAHTLRETLGLTGCRTLGNVLKPGQIVTEVQVPEPPEWSKQKYLKFRLRKAIDFAIVSVASVITMEDGVCKDARIALGAVAPTPIRATKAEKAIKGKVVNTTMAEAAAQAAVAGAAPLSMNEYKVEITKALVKRALLA